jgi:hypothetical protein
MNVAIEGHLFDTTKAKKHYELRYWDGNNWITGDLYQSSRGTWYVYTPSQWADRRSWELISIQEALERYREYLSEDEIDQIVDDENIETE